MISSYLSRHPTQLRAVSAIVGLAIMAGAAYFGAMGLMLISWIVILWATRELSRMLFQDGALFEKILFFITCQALFAVVVSNSFVASVLTPLVFTIAFSVALLRVKDEASLKSQFSFFARLSLGAIYIGLLPALSIRLLNLYDGIFWYFSLLGLVFFGDIFAFFAGRLFGRHLLNPTISPKKTIEGAVGGLFGSGLVVIIMMQFRPTLNWTWILIGLLAGALGQFGDFFESTIKRVAGQKDSGTIMPGHGGVLDRIDGVLFAGPWFLLCAYLFESGVF